jgi:tetratricopeptide (TPR) repeat protein
VVARLIFEEAGAYAEVGQAQRARTGYEQALAIREGTLGTNHPELARSLDGLGAVLVQQAEYVQAEAVLQRAVAIHERGGTAPAELGASLSELGLAYAGLRRYDEAEAALRRSLTIVEQELGPEDPLAVTTRERYARVRAERGEPSAN